MTREFKISYIRELCRGKRVLDIGCVDAGVTEEKIAKGEWLHGEIVKVATKVIGVDTNCVGIDHLQGLGYAVSYMDIESPPWMSIDCPFEPDIIVMGDVIEHLGQPLLALTNICDTMSQSARLVVTTPNAFWWVRFFDALIRRERVHPDHTCWYSAQTLRQTLERAGFRIIEDVDTIRYKPRITGPKSFLDYLMVLISRRLCERLIVLAEKA